MAEKKLKQILWWCKQRLTKASRVTNIVILFGFLENLMKNYETIEHLSLPPLP